VGWARKVASTGPKWHDPLQTLGLGRFHEPLGKRVQIWTPGRQDQWLHATTPQPWSKASTHPFSEAPSWAEFRLSRDCTAASDFATHRDVRDLTRRCAFTETVWRGCRGDPIGRHPVELGRNRCIYPFERPASNMIQADRRWIAHRQMSHRGWTTVAGVDASPPWVSLRDRSQGHPPGPSSIPA
jgi:hypothetical protein